MKSILLVKKFLGLVEMTSGLVNASFSLPEWQAVKMIFFAPWVITPMTRCGLVTNGTLCMVHNPCGPSNKVKGVVREEVDYYFASKTSVQRK